MGFSASLLPKQSIWRIEAFPFLLSSFQNLVSQKAFLWKSRCLRLDLLIFPKWILEFARFGLVDLIAFFLYHLSKFFLLNFPSNLWVYGELGFMDFIKICIITSPSWGKWLLSSFPFFFWGKKQHVSFHLIKHVMLESYWRFFLFDQNMFFPVVMLVKVFLVFLLIFLVILPYFV